MSDNTPPNIRLVKDAYLAFSRGDIDAVVSAMDADISWHEAENSLWHAAGGHHGPSEVLANVFARIPDSFDAFEVDPLRFHDAGDVVIVEGRYRAKAANTGDPLDAQVCHIWGIRAGKLASFRQYTDTWQFSRVTGTQPS